MAIRNQYVLGIDLGTSGVKSVVFGADGTVAGTATAPLDLAMPRPGWSEQDPAQWWDITCASVRAVLIRTAIAPTEIGGIGISGQMHGAVLLDAGGAVLRPCILWNDQRSALQCAEIARRAGGSARIHHLARTAPDVFRSSGGHDRGRGGDTRATAPPVRLSAHRARALAVLVRDAPGRPALPVSPAPLAEALRRLRLLLIEEP